MESSAARQRGEREAPDERADELQSGWILSFPRPTQALRLGFLTYNYLEYDEHDRRR